MKNFFLVLFFIGQSGLLASPVGAQPNPNFPTPPRLISVTGEAEVKVVPDKVYVYFGVETLDPVLAAAKQKNDEIVKKALEVTRQMKIEDKFVQTDYVSVMPKYDSVYREAIRANENVLTGYYVRKSIGICLKDVSRFEELLNRMLEVGVNYVQGVNFRTTELRKYRDQARAMAIKAAREKAEALAKELGIKIGKPYTISEYGGGWWSGYSSWWGQGYGGFYQAQNVGQNMAAYGAGEGTNEHDEAVALGMIRVNASVSVSFELE